MREYVVRATDSGVPRISLAEKYYSEAEDHQGFDDWVIVYDFEGKPNPRFWENMHRLLLIEPGSRFLQYSVFAAGSRRVARAAVILVRHYRGAVEAFRVEQDEP